MTQEQKISLLESQLQRLKDFIRVEYQELVDQNTRLLAELKLLRSVKQNLN